MCQFRTAPMCENVNLLCADRLATFFIKTFWFSIRKHAFIKINGVVISDKRRETSNNKLLCPTATGSSDAPELHGSLPARPPRRRPIV